MVGGYKLVNLNIEGALFLANGGTGKCDGLYEILESTKNKPLCFTNLVIEEIEFNSFFASAHLGEDSKYVFEGCGYTFKVSSADIVQVSKN